MTRTVSLLLLFLFAVVAFSLLFSGIVFHFWLQMACSVAGLCVAATCVDKGVIRQLLARPRQGWLHAVGVGFLTAVSR